MSRREILEERILLMKNTHPSLHGGLLTNLLFLHTALTVWLYEITHTSTPTTQLVGFTLSFFRSFFLSFVLLFFRSFFLSLFHSFFLFFVLSFFQNTHTHQHRLPPTCWTSCWKTQSCRRWCSRTLRCCQMLSRRLWWCRTSWTTSRMQWTALE